MEDMESLDVKAARPLQATHKIIMVRGGADLVFRRSNTPRCVQARGTADTVAAIKTYYQGSALLIEREGTVISVHRDGGMRIPGMGRVFCGPVSQAVARSIVMVNGPQVSLAGESVPLGRALIDLPEMPRLSIQDSSEVIEDGTLVPLPSLGLNATDLE